MWIAGEGNFGTASRGHRQEQGQLTSGKMATHMQPNIFRGVGPAGCIFGFSVGSPQELSRVCGSVSHWDTVVADRQSGTRKEEQLIANNLRAMPSSQHSELPC